MVTSKKSETLKTNNKKGNQILDITGESYYKEYRYYNHKLQIIINIHNLMYILKLNIILEILCKHYEL